MTTMCHLLARIAMAALLVAPVLATEQDPPAKDARRPAPKQSDDGPPGFGPRGPGGPGGPGGPMGQQRKIVKQFDKDGDGRLNKEERQAAREFLKSDGAGRRPFGFGPGGRGNQDPPKPGPHLAPADVKSYPESSLYEPNVLRTFFFEFEDPDWEAELADFYHTDVEVPATLVVDGKRYPNVGVHFRGSSSFFGVGAGYKRSLSLSLDFAESKQRLYGYKSLNLLNSHDDPSFMSTVLYSDIARKYIPCPKANFVKVVINGECWGVYVNAQQFNKEFLTENYKSSKGMRWKVKGSPGGGGGLDYAGDNPEDYKRRYEIKSADEAKSWKALIALCKTLSETPPEKLEEALTPILDIDSLLWFLALDVTLINCDGYWVRASDYNLYRDEKGKFHVVPHDMNECFRPAQGPGMGGGPGGINMRMPAPGQILPEPLQDMLRLSDDQRKQLERLQKEIDEKLSKILTADQRSQFKDLQTRGPGAFGMAGPGGPGGGPGPRGGPGGGSGNVELDPLIGLNDARKPLRSKVLAVPAFRLRYLQHVKTIADEWLDWKKLGPIVSQYRSLIEPEIEGDTRKLDSFASFQRLTADAPGAERGPQGRGPNQMGLHAFADARRRYLLNHPEVKKAAPG